MASRLIEPTVHCERGDIWEIRLCWVDTKHHSQGKVEPQIPEKKKKKRLTTCETDTGVFNCFFVLISGQCFVAFNFGCHPVCACFVNKGKLCFICVSDWIRIAPSMCSVPQQPQPPLTPTAERLTSKHLRWNVPNDGNMPVFMCNLRVPTHKTANTYGFLTDDAWMFWKLMFDVWGFTFFQATVFWVLTVWVFVLKDILWQQMQGVNLLILYNSICTVSVANDLWPFPCLNDHYTLHQKRRV